MKTDTVQQIKDRLNIADVVSQYVPLTRSGVTLKARCPFHAEKSPSFTVSPDRGTYHCFGCGVGGDMFSFIEAIEGIDFKGALKILADKAGVEIVYQSSNKEEKDEKGRLYELLEAATIFYTSHLADDARRYLEGRGLTDETIKMFRLGLAGNAWADASDFLQQKGFAEKELIDAGLSKKTERGSLVDKFRNRIMFPIADNAGRVVAFSGRSFGPHASPEAPKYLNSPETVLFHKSRILYGFDKAKINMRKHNCAVLVEGQMDLVMSHQEGWANTVAVSGTAFTTEHAALIKRMTDNIVLGLDGDAAGVKAAGRAARVALAGGLNVKVVQLPTGLDPADLILKEGKDAWRAAIRGAKDIILFLLDVLEAHAKSTDIFRRSVESVVLPFLSDVQSPIAQEQYLHEIAKRLGVSIESVSRALGNVPIVPSVPAMVPAASPVYEKPKSDRAREAYALILWQRSLSKPVFDVDAYERRLEESVGAEIMQFLREASDAQKEAMRFGAEKIHRSDNARASMETLLRVAHAERLSSELRSLTQALQHAEAEGNEESAEALMLECQLLTTRIAQLHV